MRKVTLLVFVLWYAQAILNIPSAYAHDTDLDDRLERISQNMRRMNGGPVEEERERELEDGSGDAMVDDEDDEEEFGSGRGEVFGMGPFGPDRQHPITKPPTVHPGTRGRPANTTNTANAATHHRPAVLLIIALFLSIII